MFSYCFLPFESTTHLYERHFTTAYVLVSHLLRKHEELLQISHSKSLPGCRPNIVDFKTTNSNIHGLTIYDQVTRKFEVAASDVPAFGLVISPHGQNPHRRGGTGEKSAHMFTCTHCLLFMRHVSFKGYLCTFLLYCEIFACGPSLKKYQCFCCCFCHQLYVQLRSV